MKYNLNTRCARKSLLRRSNESHDVRVLMDRSSAESLPCDNQHCYEEKHGCRIDANWFYRNEWRRSIIVTTIHLASAMFRRRRRIRGCRQLRSTRRAVLRESSEDSYEGVRSLNQKYMIKIPYVSSKNDLYVKIIARERVEINNSEIKSIDRSSVEHFITSRERLIGRVHGRLISSRRRGIFLAMIYIFLKKVNVRIEITFQGIASRRELL